MSKRRALIGVGLLAIALAIGVWRWRRGSEATSSATTGTTAHVPGQPSAPPAGDTPRWVGQTGVGGRRIAGVVLGETGAPIAGASVRLASVATNAGLSAAANVVTDGSGRFDFGGRPGADYVVVADAPHLTGAVDSIDLRDPQLVPPPDQLRLVLHACETSIHGIIRDGAGGVVPGARIARDRVTTTGGAESDAAGNYELCLPAGGARVLVTGDGYAVLAASVNVFGRTRRDFELVPGASLGGRVIRADDKTPVAGAIVQLQPEDYPSGGTTLFAASDAEGHFHVEGVTPGRHQVTARADRLATAGPVDAIAEIGRPSEDVVCELMATVTVSGKVVVRGTDTPVPGATVYLGASGGRGTRGASAITQSDGSFTIDRILPGEYRPVVFPMARNRSPDQPPVEKVMVEAKDVTGVVIAVELTGTISGRILHGGQPVDGARVMIENSAMATESNQDGSYTLRGLAAGEYKVYAESHRVGAFARSAPATLAKGEDRKGVDVELSLSGSIAGIVVDEANAPVPGAFLSFSLLHGRDFGSATTADDGTFTARSLSGGGEYLYDVRQRDGSPLIFAPADGKRFAPIAVADGGTHVTGLRVRIKVERLSIAGRVTDAANKPVTDVVVHAVPDQYSGYGYSPGTAANSDQTGAFTIRDLPSGSYTLQASGTRGDARVDNVTAGQTNVSVRLVELGGIDGTLEGFTGAEITAYEIAGVGRPHRAVVTGSAFTIRNLSAGEYRIVATSPSASEYTTTTVTPGAIAKVSFRRHETGTVEGIVVDEKTRAPVVGIYCISGLGNDGAYGAMSASGATDARGGFRLERAPVGKNSVMCAGRASGTAIVTAGQVTHIELTAEAPRAEPRKADAGMTLESQLGEVLVESVKPGGPAARAGVLRGDVVLKIGDTDVKSYGQYTAARLLEDSPAGTAVKLTLERNDKQVVVTVTLDPAS